MDTLNNTNYSFQFRFPDTPISTFYNLVVGETPTGEVLTPYVMKYTCDDANLDTYIANGLDFKYFNGTMSIHKYTDFFALGEFDKIETLCTPELDEVGDPIPCNQTPVSGGGSGIGGDTGSGNTGGIGNTGGGGSNGTVTCTNEIYVIGCNGNMSGSLHPIGECGSPDYDTVTEHNVWVCDGMPVLGGNQVDGTVRTVNDDCPECETSPDGVGINTNSNAIDKDALTVINNCSYFEQDLILDIVNMQLETAAANYIDENGCSSEIAQFIEEAIIEFDNILDELPDAKFERYIELLELIKEDPWVLIQDCAEQNGMDTSNYIDLYNHTIPQECQNRLDNLGSEYNNQPISEGNVPLANIDYYGVEVTNYPDFDNDGNPDTETEIYQAFREKFTDLASGEKDDFQFSCDVPTDSDNIGHISWEFLPYNNYDLNLWNSQQNPITTIIGIDGGSNELDFDLASDDGAIMISKYDNNSWIGSTITTPITGSQPFSGNREWGWIINQNGNLEFFTRAVDVAKVSALVKALSFGSDPCQEETYYNIAETTWANMQDEIKEWIENEGDGQVSVKTPKTVRIKKETIEEILTTTNNINEILSNCN
jgi:hypothetical protein